VKNKLTSAGQEGSRQAASVRRHEITAAASGEGFLGSPHVVLLFSLADDAD